MQKTCYVLTEGEAGVCSWTSSTMSVIDQQSQVHSVLQNRSKRVERL